MSDYGNNMRKAKDESAEGYINSAEIYVGKKFSESERIYFKTLFSLAFLDGARFESENK